MSDAIVSMTMQIFVILAPVFIVLFVLAVLGQILEAYLARRASQRKVEIAERNLTQEPEKVKPAWDLARATLEQYFSRNLAQINAIFWLSVSVMIAGFGIIVWGISQAMQTPDATAVAAIAAFAGVITEFIGATFLFIYRSTIQQAMEYSKTLERINSVGMALQVLDTIPDAPVSIENELKSKTKAQLVEHIMKQAQVLPSSAANTNP